jgi:arginyl-tRNA--protein-N-Asp/Glu arginylyltransferase
VYCYFDRDLPGRGLGTFNVLWLLGEARRRRLPHVYLGYYVEGAPTMEYKAGYRPCELLRPDGSWEPRAWAVARPSLGRHSAGSSLQAPARVGDASAFVSARR